MDTVTINAADFSISSNSIVLPSLGHRRAISWNSHMSRHETRSALTSRMDQQSVANSEFNASINSISPSPMSATSEFKKASSEPIHPMLIAPVGLQPEIGDCPASARSDPGFEAIRDDPPRVGLRASSTDSPRRPTVDPLHISTSNFMVSPIAIPLPPSPSSMMGGLDASPPPPIPRLPTTNIPPPPPMSQFRPPQPPPPHPSPPPPPTTGGQRNSYVTWDDSYLSFHPKTKISRLGLDDESLPDSSSFYSDTRKRPEPSSTSDYLSFDDPIIYENARHFPPRLPTAPPFSKEHTRTLARRKIHSWISRYESSQGTRSDRFRDRGTDTGLEKDHDGSSTFSYPSNSSMDVEIEDLWRRINSKRTQLRHLKDQMAQKRKGLKDLRRKKDAADNAFMSAVRPMMVSKGTLQQASVSHLERHMSEMQALRDEYQELETSYEELEEHLDKEEEELDQLELRFFSMLGTGDYADDMDISTRLDSNIDHSADMPVDLLGISPHKPVEDLHPHFVELSLAIASLQNEREELSSLLATKNHCDSELANKKRLGQKVPRDIVEFLSDFKAQEAQKMNEVSSNEREVSRLRHLCEENDVMGKHLSIHMAMALDPNLEFEDLRLDDEAVILSDRENMAHATFPDLLSQPDHLLWEAGPLLPRAAMHEATKLPDHDTQKQYKIQIAQKQDEIHQLMADINTDDGKAGFISRWLLHSLRISPLEAILLHSTFIAESKLQIMDLSRWQRDVLSYWWNDDTVMSVENYGQPDKSSQYYSRVGTPPQTRAASENFITVQLHHSHRRSRSNDAHTHGTR